MTESVITEFLGEERDAASRIIYYGVDGVRVLDRTGVTRRLYRFDPSSGTMTEVDPARQGTILRRFVFDMYGMLEETFSVGQPPRTFRYEAGGERIVVREGGDYGAVGKTFSFESTGVSETAFGREGSIERVYIFEPGGSGITIRKGGWYGAIERRLVCQRVDASVFREPEAFLQFLMFTDRSEQEKEAEIAGKVAEIRAEPASGRSRYAYPGVRHTMEDPDRESEIAPRSRIARQSLPTRGMTGDPAPGRRPGPDVSGIDFIPDADAPSHDAPRAPLARGGGGPVSFEERWQHVAAKRQEITPGRSARIPLDERFRSSRDEDRTLTKGRSADIPLEERFRPSREEKGEMSPGRSAEIPYEERRAIKRPPGDGAGK